MDWRDVVVGIGADAHCETELVDAALGR